MGKIVYSRSSSPGISAAYLTFDEKVLIARRLPLSYKHTIAAVYTKGDPSCCGISQASGFSFPHGKKGADNIFNSYGSSLKEEKLSYNEAVDIAAEVLNNARKTAYGLVMGSLSEGQLGELAREALEKAEWKCVQDFHNFNSGNRVYIYCALGLARPGR